MPEPFAPRPPSPAKRLTISVRLSGGRSRLPTTTSTEASTKEVVNRVRRPSIAGTRRQRHPAARPPSSASPTTSRAAKRARVSASSHRGTRPGAEGDRGGVEGVDRQDDHDRQHRQDPAALPERHPSQPVTAAPHHRAQPDHEGPDHELAGAAREQPDQGLEDVLADHVVPGRLAQRAGKQADGGRDHDRGAEGQPERHRAQPADPGTAQEDGLDDRHHADQEGRLGASDPTTGQDGSGGGEDEQHRKDVAADPRGSHRLGAELVQGAGAPGRRRRSGEAG